MPTKANRALTVSGAPANAPTAAIAPLTLRQAQIRLAELNLYSGAIDGQLGAATVTAIKTFQKVRGIPETGALDSATEKALRGVAR